MGLTNWFRNKFGALSMSISNVEKNLLSQNSESNLASETQETRNIHQGKLMDSLIRGEITDEVKNLRWRTYKVFQAMGKNKKYQTFIDEDTNKEVRIPIARDFSHERNSVKIDDYDPYPLEISVKNEGITASRSEALEEATSDVLTLQQHSSVNEHKPVFVNRDAPTKFEIEKYTFKLNVRTINENEKLLEFYIPKLHDENNNRHKFFLRELKRGIENPKSAPFLDIKGVGFVTNNTTGAFDNLAYEYEIIKFDKIIEFRGFYVVKYVAKLVLDGYDILQDYIIKELDEKYENKERRNP